ncbi:hypothetical protein ACH79_06465 [Bradyrhizobium sp. CCBAU 051011]|nr:hypothetical protein ACH79_06465 [Bradyrhizobium sp. CCBAU 051011]
MICFPKSRTDLRYRPCHIIEHFDVAVFSGRFAERYAKGETIADLAIDSEVGAGTIHRALNPPSH